MLQGYWIERRQGLPTLPNLSRQRHAADFDLDTLTLSKSGDKRYKLAVNTLTQNRLVGRKKNFAGAVVFWPLARCIGR